MVVTAQDVKKLREATGAGPVDCKNALEAANGDFAAAERALKEKGLAAVEKRADRATNEGRIFLKEKGTDAAGGTVALVELVSETDFVAKNPDFIVLGGDIAKEVLEQGITEPTDALAAKVTELATKIREKMSLKRIKLIKAASNQYVSSYIHGDGQNLGVAVVVEADKPEVFANAELREFVHNLALHVAAFNPKVLARENVEAAFLKEQEEIFAAQMKTDPKFEGKPANVLENALKGKINKYLSDICFLDQAYVKDDKIKVCAALDAEGKKAGAKLTIKSYVYLKVGGE